MGRWSEVEGKVFYIVFSPNIFFIFWGWFFDFSSVFLGFEVFGFCLVRFSMAFSTDISPQGSFFGLPQCTPYLATLQSTKVATNPVARFYMATIRLLNERITEPFKRINAVIECSRRARDEYW